MLAGLIVLAAAAGATITVHDDPHPKAVTVGADGKLLAGPNGLPLYSYDGDLANNYCRDDCLKSWPPLLAGSDDKPIGDWKPYMRPEGFTQWLYQGRPIYSYRGDRRAGTAAGDGIGGAWHAVVYGGKIPRIPVPSAAKVSRIDTGFVLTNAQGFTLYSFARDGSKPACRGECLEVWPPLLAPALALPVGQWNPIDRPDGLRQWAWRGRLLYTFSEDLAPGDQLGANAGGLWKSMKVTQRDERPER